MRIDHLTIRNFKGFEEKEFSFMRDSSTDGRVREESLPQTNGSFHVLIGENGSGKSTALDALAVALGVWFVARPGAEWRSIRPEDARLVVTKTGDTVRFDPVPDVFVAAEGTIGGQIVKWRRVGPAVHSTGRDPGQIAVGDLLSRTSKEENLSLPILGYYGTGRAWLSPKERTSNFEPNLTKVSRFDAYNNCLDGRIRDKELQQWFLFEAVEAAQRGKKREGMIAVENAILSCMPGATGLRFDGDRREIVATVQDGEKPFYSLSDGQRSMLSLVADVAIKAVILNPHLGRDAAKLSPGVVLIDELDLHLHPKWQQRVVEDLRTAFPNIQFICTTHSPFIVQTLRAGELINLDAQPLQDVSNLSIGQIARGLMGVPQTDVSPRYEAMKLAAKDYLTTLDEAAAAPEEKLAQYEEKLAEGLGPYADNPAFQAFLELKHEAKLGGRLHANVQSEASA